MLMSAGAGTEEVARFPSEQEADGTRSGGTGCASNTASDISSSMIPLRSKLTPEGFGPARGGVPRRPVILRLPGEARLLNEPRCLGSDGANYSSLARNASSAPLNLSGYSRNII
jgi:hypothetical protein